MSFLQGLPNRSNFLSKPDNRADKKPAVIPQYIAVHDTSPSQVVTSDPTHPLIRSIVQAGNTRKPARDGKQEKELEKKKSVDMFSQDLSTPMDTDRTESKRPAPDAKQGAEPKRFKAERVEPKATPAPARPAAPTPVAARLAASSSSSSSPPVARSSTSAQAAPASAATKTKGPDSDKPPKGGSKGKR
eukprot:TRINITY_DN6936_c0_g1_i1.p1 TRINITY_DN6936_c0_g1~~TRINITY_DN6936_c0_g1_i1.p1  ORF type:complete len:188 (-),score=21.11 TRINITY_DN6936_c0_g1_i1:109-672(-)